MNKLAFALTSSFAALALVEPAFACACFAPGNEAVVFGSQRNIIVWDSKNQTEHFVRHAEFNTKATDFGFIMPTPSLPELAEVDPQAFALLEQYVLSEYEKHSSAKGAMQSKAMQAGVEVLRKQDVGDYRTVSVKGSDSAAITSYLKKNGYEIGPDTKKWVAFYAKKSWVLTAFKLKGKPRSNAKLPSRWPSAPRVELSPVRVSFKTKEPFNPYYVPKNNLTKSRSEVTAYFFAQEFAVGTLNKQVFAHNRTSHLEPPLKMLREIRQHLRLPKSAVMGTKLTVIQQAAFAQVESDDIYFRKASERLMNFTAQVDRQQRTLFSMLIPELG